jgi:hypothetical protein
MRKAVAILTVASTFGMAAFSLSLEASAQVTGNVNAVTPTGKGITGCALLGAETVALIEAAAGVRPRWAYIVFPLVGGVAGGVGGYFLESAASTSTDSTLTGISVGTLVLGLGLVVPTVVAYVNATSYHPDADVVNEDNAPSNAPIDESTGAPEAAPAAPAGTTTTPAPSGGTGGGTTPAPGTSMRRTGHGRALVAGPVFRATGLIDFASGTPSMTVPAVSVENSISLHDMRQYGLAPQSELRIPVVSGSF